MALRHNTNYDPKYPWRPGYYWDKCPACFENFDMDHQCDNCGSGHSDHDITRPEVTVLPYMGEPKPGDKRYIPPQPTIPLTHAQLKDLKDGV